MTNQYEAFHRNRTQEVVGVRLAPWRKARKRAFFVKQAGRLGVHPAGKTRINRYTASDGPTQAPHSHKQYWHPGNGRYQRNPYYGRGHRAESGVPAAAAAWGALVTLWVSLMSCNPRVTSSRRRPSTARAIRAGEVKAMVALVASAFVDDER
jgi:hypothetical protein